MRNVVLVLGWFFLCILQSGPATAQTGPDTGGAGLPEVAGATADQAEPGLKELHQMADQGNAAAQALLGLMYAEGHDVAKDERQAAAWLQKAADQGDATAQTLLGKMYAEGRGVAKDERQAAAWYRKAAAQGDKDAQDALEAITLTAPAANPDSP